MILSIHQPNFLPWIGYFSKVNQSDIFILLDNIQYPRGKSVANRASIKTPNGPLELVVPIPKSNFSTSNGIFNYNDIFFTNANWNAKMIKSITQAYSKAPFFYHYWDRIKEMVCLSSFSEMNVSFIKFIICELELKTKVYRLSEIPNISDERNQRIIDLCNHFRANVYLSGSGGKNYNDENLFKRNDISIKYSDYIPKSYPQPWGTFTPNLSVIDLLFNCGKDGRLFL